MQLRSGRFSSARNEFLSLYALTSPLLCWRPQASLMLFWCLVLGFGFFHNLQVTFAAQTSSAKRPRHNHTTHTSTPDSGQRQLVCALVQPKETRRVPSNAPGSAVLLPPRVWHVVGLLRQHLCQLQLRDLGQLHRAQRASLANALCFLAFHRSQLGIPRPTRGAAG